MIKLDKTINVRTKTKEIYKTYAVLWGGGPVRLSYIELQYLQIKNKEVKN